MPLFEADGAELSALADLVNTAYRRPNDPAAWTHEGDYIGGQRTSAEALRDDLAAAPAARLMTLRDASDAPLLGCVWLEPAEEGVWYLGMLTVRPDLQARQLGRRILEAAEQHAVAAGARRMRMTVVHLREALIAWYVRRGYAPTGERRPFPSDQRFGQPRQPLELVVLEKALNLSTTA